jgi:prefoldin alpha subunit
MAQPQMVDVRQLNPQQLTEVSQRIDQELAVLSGCHNELVSVKQKFITAREAVHDIKGANGQNLMVPLTGSLYVRGKLSQQDAFIVDIGTNYYVEKDHAAAMEFFDRKLKYVEENLEKVEPQVRQKQTSKMMVQRELMDKMKAAKMVKPTK